MASRPNASRPPLPSLPVRVPVDKVMAEARAASFTKRSIKGDAKAWALRLALSMVDLTTLEGKDTPEKVRALCRKAVDPTDGTIADAPKVAAICVYPQLVGAARRELEKLGALGEVKIAAVATGFPSGQYPLKVRMDDTRRAVEAGADEIDMVISRGAYLAGEHRQVYDEVCATVEACGFVAGGGKKGRARGEGFAHLKVILETGELETLDNARHASDLAIAALHDTGMAGVPGASFIKTSTGKVEPAATMPVTLVMLQALADHHDRTGELIGMKPAGGIRTSKSAVHYLCMLSETLGEIERGAYLTPGLFRFGASALVNDLCRQMQWQHSGKYAARYDFAEA
jgi:deoxyribose-phosphate aldolase